MSEMAREWRVVATDYGNDDADISSRSEWTTDEQDARETFRVWMDETKPPYDSVWIQTRVASSPERVDGWTFFQQVRSGNERPHHR